MVNADFWLKSSGKNDEMVYMSSDIFIQCPFGKESLLL